MNKLIIDIAFPFLYQIGLQHKTDEHPNLRTCLTVVITVLIFVAVFPTLLEYFIAAFQETETESLNRLSAFGTYYYYPKWLNSVAYAPFTIFGGTYILWAIFSKTTNKTVSYTKCLLSFSPTVVTTFIPFGELGINYTPYMFIPINFGGILWALTFLTIELKKQYGLSVRKSIFTSAFVLIALFMLRAGFLGFTANLYI